MKTYKLIIAAALISLSASAQIKTSDFPANMKYLGHLDLKALCSSKVGDMIKETMDEEATSKMAAFTALSGIDMMKDIDSLYFMGDEGNSDAAMLYASGRFDVKKLTTIIGGNDDFKSEACGSHQLLSWVDDDTPHHGCFVNSGFAIGADSIETLKKAIAIIDGKGESLAATSPFAKIIGNKPGRFVTIAAKEVATMAKDAPMLPMLGQVNSLVFSVDQPSAATCDLLLKAIVSSPDTEKAQELAAMLNGFKAMIALGSAENPEVAALANNFNVEMKNTKLSMGLKITEADLRKQLVEGMKKASEDEPPAEEMTPPAATMQ